MIKDSYRCALSKSQFLLSALPLLMSMVILLNSYVTGLMDAYPIKMSFLQGTISASIIVQGNVATAVGRPLPVLNTETVLVFAYMVFREVVVVDDGVWLRVLIGFTLVLLYSYGIRAVLGLAKALDLPILTIDERILRKKDS